MRAARLEDFQLQAQTGSCLVPGCEGEVEARGLCERHYQRARRGRDLSVPEPPKFGSLLERLEERALLHVDAAPEERGRTEHALRKAAVAYRDREGALSVPADGLSGWDRLEAAAWRYAEAESDAEYAAAREGLTLAARCYGWAREAA